MVKTVKLLLVLALIALTMMVVACKPIEYYLQMVYKAYGEVTDAESGDSIESVEVFISGSQYSELTNGLGDYEIELAEGTWTLDFIKYGYEVATVEVTVNDETPREEVNVALVPLPPPENGTIRVRVTDVTYPDIPDNTIIYCAVGALGADLFDSDNYLGTEPQGTTFVGGIAEFVVIEFDTPANMEMVFTGGETYDLVVVIDYNGDDEYSSWIDYITFQSVLVDGNTILELVYPTDFTVGPPPGDGTITVRITGADAHNDVDFMGAVGAAGADLNDPANSLADFVFPIVNGIGEGAAIPVGADPDAIPPPIPVTFTGGESYDVGGMIDANYDGEYTPGVDYIFKEWVENVVVDGDTILRLVYPTDFILAP